MPRKTNKKKVTKFLSLLLLGLGFGGGYVSYQYLQPPPPIPLEKQDTIEVYFSPKGGCTDAVVYNIHLAKKEIYVYAFAFTSKPIADALIEAHQRGVEVRIIADKGQSRNKYCQLPRLRAAGILIWIDKTSGYAHNKVMMIDGTYLITGSFNWSSGAEYRNAENLLIIKKKSLVVIYKNNWHMRMKNATIYS